jgi:type IV pilus assembly protein PilQ
VPTVQFKTAALNLQVTPRITSANTVILEVDVDNGSRGAAVNQFNTNIAINTQRAQTTVLVGDGATTVIGGIQVTVDSDSEERTPGLWRLPWIGRLFRATSKTSTQDEIVIFITPRIIRMPATAPAGAAVPPPGQQQ